jgi:hypothetical protein
LAAWRNYLKVPYVADGDKGVEDANQVEENNVVDSDDPDCCPWVSNA